MAKTKTAPTTVFTQAERVVLARHANAVWNEIAYDLLTAVAEEKGKDVNAVTVSRAEVLELVLDADRLFERVRRDKDATPELKARCTYDHARAIEEVLKQDAFRYGRYGM